MHAVEGQGSLHSMLPALVCSRSGEGAVQLLASVYAWIEMSFLGAWTDGRTDGYTHAANVGMPKTGWKLASAWIVPL